MRLKLEDMDFAGSTCVGICEVSPGDKGHPNRMQFSGTLLILDEPSTKPPHGSEGHRIFVPKSVAKKRLDTLIGMGLNYAPDLEGHAPRRKVGVIEGAWIEGNQLKVRGVVWKKDFPEAEKDLKNGRLGMSMELADVYVKDKNDRIWYLEDFYFSGATALFKSSAAYYSTALAAAAAGLAKNLKGGGSHMAKPAKKVVKVAASEETSDAKILARAIASAVQKGNEELVAAIKGQSAKLSRVAASVEELKAVSLETLSFAKSDDDDDDDDDAMTAARKSDDDDDDDSMAAKKADDDDDDDDMSAKKSDDDDDDDDVAAAKSKSDDDDDDDDDDGSDDDDDDDMKAELEKLQDDDADWEPGQLNKKSGTSGIGYTNRGSKTNVTVGRIKKKSMPVSAMAAAAGRIKSISARAEKLERLLAKSEKVNRKLGKRLESMEAQLENYADNVDRRSVTPEFQSLLAKQGHDVRELVAEGRKLSVDEVDEVLANSGVILDVPTRMAFKNQLLAAGIMEQGEVRR